jgi:hypothetical protein
MSNQKKMEYNEIIKKAKEIFIDANINYFVLEHVTYYNNNDDFRYTLCFNDIQSDVISIQRNLNYFNKIEEDIEFWYSEQHFHITEYGFKRLKEVINQYINNYVHISYYVDRVPRSMWSTVMKKGFNLKKSVIATIKYEMNIDHYDNKNIFL